MSALTQMNTNTAVAAQPSLLDLRVDAEVALLRALTAAAKRHDHAAVAGYGEALRGLGGS